MRTPRYPSITAPVTPDARHALGHRRADGDGLDQIEAAVELRAESGREGGVEGDRVRR